MPSYKYSRDDLKHSFSVKNSISYEKTNTKDKYWWVCDINANHEWQSNLSNRLSGSGCPYCAGRKVDATNCLAKHEVAKEYSDDNEKSANQVFEFSTRKFWWICPHGHKWKSSPSDRLAGKNCIYCNGQKPSDTNNLQVIFPEVAKEWSGKNLNSPQDYLPFSKQKVWWKCEKGHEWQTDIANRTLSGSGCHICSGYSRQKKCEESNDGTQKKCNSCNIMQSKSNFRLRKSGSGHYINSLCKKCEQEKVVQYRTMTPEGIVAEIIRRKKHDCKKHNLPFDLTKKYVLSRLNEIDWRCELTGLPMRAIKSTLDEKYQGFHLDSLSLDRINHKGGYTKDNVRFVLNQVNIFRSNGSDDRMFKIAEALFKKKGIKNGKI